jgi:hypothetical protein
VVKFWATARRGPVDVTEKDKLSKRVKHKKSEKKVLTTAN